MARQPRLVFPGVPHLVWQRGHNAQAVLHDAADAADWLAIVREVAATQRVALHGWWLSGDGYALLATPQTTEGLSRLNQDLGRRYVARVNARHGRSGTLWNGRFRSAAVQPGRWERVALAWLEGLPAEPPALSSRAHHLGLGEAPGIVDPPGYWALGNTPFERHVAWQGMLDSLPAPAALAELQRALRSGRPLGDPAWRAQLQTLTAVPLEPRPRGRPRKVRAPAATGLSRSG
jgi:putative transposase